MRNHNHFLRKGSVRHGIYFEGSEREKRLRNAEMERVLPKFAILYRIYKTVFSANAECSCSHLKIMNNMYFK